MYANKLSAKCSDDGKNKENPWLRQKSPIKNMMQNASVNLIYGSHNLIVNIMVNFHAVPKRHLTYC